MFVLIAGGIILAFFVLMVMKQKGISEQGLETTIAVDLDAIFTGAQVSEGTATKIPLPRLEINVGCDGYRVGSVSRSLDSNLIFSPNLLKGRNLITWSKSWNYPFKAENFLYLTTDEVRYILACDSDCDEIKALNSSLPEEMNKEVCKDCFSDLEDLNNYKGL